MNGSTPQLSPEDVAEIEQHKYFLSEKAGYDVGWEFAEQDWKANIADHASHTHHAEHSEHSEHADQADQTDASPSAAEETSDSGGIGTLLKRLLAKVGVL